MGRWMAVSSAGPTKGNYTATSTWAEKRFVAALIRITVSLTPTIASFVATHYTSRAFPPDVVGLPMPIWWVLIISVGVIVLLLVDRAMKVFLPLVALFKLSLVFPDKAPSRFRLAMKTATTKSLERQVAEVRANGLPNDTTEQAEILLQLVASLNSHDRQTRGHCERVKAYTDMIAEELGLDEADTAKLRWAALAHDVGKLTVPQNILNKEGKPDDQEWRILQSHAWQGEKIAAPLRPWLGDWVEAIGSHHERWDGEGYPRGTAGKDIHIGARIVAVADTFDVITSKRSYKEPIPASKARAEIARCAGAQFDPKVVRAFLNVGIGRLKYTIGPLSWLANLPSAGPASITPVVSPITTAAVAIIATTAAVATNSLDLLLDYDSTPETIAFVDEEPAPNEAIVPLPELFAAPGLSDLVFTVAEDETTTAIIQATTSNGPAHLTIVEPPGSGQVTLRSDLVDADPGVTNEGALVVSYTPDPDQNGSDQFTYRLCDQAELCSEGEAEVTISPVNDAPLLEPMSDAASRIGATVALSPEASDIDGDPLIFSITGLPPGLTYSPTTGQISGEVLGSVPSGRYPITVTVTDRTTSGLSDSTTFDFVVPRATAPTALGTPISTDEDTGVHVSLLGIGRGELVSFSVVRSPSFGLLGPVGAARTTADGSADRAATIRYVPNANFHGTDSFDFQVCNRDQVCSRATVRLTVTPVNDAPAVTPISNPSYLIGDTVSIPVSTSDVDSQGLAIQVNGLPPGLSLDPTTSTITGTVANGTAGSSWPVSIEVSDQESPGLHATTTFTLSIGFADPVALALSLTANEDAVVTHPVTANTDTGELIFTIPAGQSFQGTAEFATSRSSGQVRGTRSVAANTLIYTPALNSNGSESISYQVCDTEGNCSTGVIEILITPVNDSPVISPASFDMDEDTVFEMTDEVVLALATDPEGDQLDVVWDVPADGSISDFGDRIHFTPAPDFNGSKTIEFQICDALLACTSGQVSMTVLPINDAPLITIPGPQTIHPGEDISLTVSATDVDGDTLTFHAHDLPPGISINTTTGQITGQVADDVGQASFTATAKARDGTTYTAATIEFTVENTIEQLSALGMTTNEDTANSAAFEGATSFGTLTFAVASGPSHGTISNLTPSSGGTPFVLSAFFGSFDYEPDPDYHGPDSVTIKIRDQATGTIRAHLVVPITVTPVNDAPTISAPADQAFDLGSAVSIPVTASDVDGDALTYSADNLPDGLSMNPASGLISGTIASNLVRSHFTMTVTADDNTTTASDVFEFSITQPPSGADDEITQEDTALTVHLTVTTSYSADITILVPPAHGTVANLTTPVGDSSEGISDFDVSFDYTPDPNTYGNDQITIRACNTHTPTDCDDHTISIYVEAVNDAPHIDPHPAISISDGTLVNVAVSASDIDGNILVYSATGLPEGLSIDPNTGVISGIYVQPGSATGYTSTITVTHAACPCGTDETFTFVVD